MEDLAVVPLVDDHKRKSPFSKEKGDFYVIEKGRGDKSFYSILYLTHIYFLYMLVCLFY